MPSKPYGQRSSRAYNIQRNQRLRQRELRRACACLPGGMPEFLRFLPGQDLVCLPVADAKMVRSMSSVKNIIVPIQAST